MVVLLALPWPVAARPAREPHVAIGLNVLQPTLYGLASAFFDNSYFVPVPLDVHVRITRRWGLLTGLQYLAHKDGLYKVNGIETGIGPRLTIVGNGLRGLYAAFRLGFGFLKGNDYSNASYYRVSMIFQPELGYALAWRPPSVYLAFGLGLQAAVTLTESDHGWDWNSLGKMINYYMPLANITVGFAL